MVDLARLGALARAAQPMPEEGVKVVPDTVPGRVVHIDGDMLAYFCAGGDAMAKDSAKRALLARCRNIQELSGSDKAVIQLTARGSNKGLREAISTLGPKVYQAQRKGHKPKNWEYLRMLMEEDRVPYPVIKSLDREADDAMASAAHRSNDNLTVIATRDKDLRMVTGCWHLTWDEFELLHVPTGCYRMQDSKGREYGEYWFWAQMLQGDTVDHVAGLPLLFGKKCGEGTAAKYLAPAGNSELAYRMVAGAYQAYYGVDWQRQFCVQALLLWMRRTAAIDDFIPGLMASTNGLIGELRNAADEILEWVYE